MSFLKIVLFFAFLVLISETRLEIGSCARMDTPVLEKIARAQCITSCSVQNCGTGYCEKRGGRPTCVCSRCDKGGKVPVDKIAGGISRGIKG